MTAYIFDTFGILLPLFIVIGSGWMLSSFFDLNEDTLTRVLTDFFMPLLVFGSLYRSETTPADMVDLLGVVVFFIVALYLAAFLYSRFTNTDHRGIAIPVIFMNSGFLGIPLMQLWSGYEAMNIIIIFDQIETFFLFTFGILIVGGGFSLKGLRFTLLSPILWAVVLGFTANLLKIPLPDILLDTCSFAGAAASPMAAFVVGCSLSSRKPRVDPRVLWGIFLRMGYGLALGLGAVYIFHLEGITATVILVASALPSAVFSYVLPARYGAPSEDAQSIVIISTILSVIVIPLTFLLAQYL